MADVIFDGTLTPLRTDLTNYRPSGSPGTNVPTNLSVDPEDLRNVPCEIVQFITALAQGYDIHWWAAELLVETWLRALKDSRTSAQPATVPACPSGVFAQ